MMNTNNKPNGKITKKGSEQAKQILGITRAFDCDREMFEKYLDLAVELSK